VTNKASVFFFLVYILPSNKLTSACTVPEPDVYHSVITFLTVYYEANMKNIGSEASFYISDHS